MGVMHRKPHDGTTVSTDIIVDDPAFFLIAFAFVLWAVSVSFDERVTCDVHRRLFWCLLTLGEFCWD